jgi:integrase
MLKKRGRYFPRMGARFMARHGKPWFRVDRGVWVAKIGGKLVTLGPDESAARLRFNELSGKPLEPTVQDIITSHAAWIASRVQAGEVSAVTARTYGHHGRWLARHAGGRPAASLRGVDLLGWLNDAPGLTTSSRASYGRHTKQLFRWAASVGLIASNPIDRTPIPGVRGRQGDLTREDAVRALESIKAWRFARIARFIFLTGCRSSEAWKLTHEMIDRERGVAVLPVHKTARYGIARMIPLSVEALALVGSGTGHVFTTKSGKPWTTIQISSRFATLAKQTGVHIHAHALRSLWATDALCDGVPVSVVAACLGNSPAILKKHYDRTSTRVDLLIVAARKVRA